MRISALLFSAAICLAVPVLRAQDPGAAQDAEAAREKLLKAQDELANIQANSESTRTAVDGVKTDVTSLQQNVTALQNENATLKQQLADLQAAFDQYKADQAKERQQLISNVADMIAAGKSTKKKKSDAETTEPASAPTPTASTEVHSSLAPSLAPPPDPGSDNPPPAPKKQHGFYYTVVKGDTVPNIAAAYRDAGREGHLGTNPQGQRTHCRQRADSGPENFHSETGKLDMSEETPVQGIDDGFDLAREKGAGQRRLWPGRHADAQGLGQLRADRARGRDRRERRQLAAPRLRSEFLEMLWTVKLPGGETYGPTTVGTPARVHQRGPRHGQDPRVALQDAPVAAAGRARRCR